MTKQRPPLTFNRALTRIADVLGWDGCAHICGTAERTVRNWSDPDTGSEISIRDALRLDVAFQKAGGVGAPMFECYTVQLEMDGMRRAGDLDALVTASAASAKEAGEAISALIHAARAGATDADVRRARIEGEEAITAITLNLNLLDQGGN